MQIHWQCAYESKYSLRYDNDDKKISCLTCLCPLSWSGSCQAVGTSPSRRWAAACGRPARGSSPPSGRQPGPGRSRPHVQSAPRNSAINVNSVSKVCLRNLFYNIVRDRFLSFSSKIQLQLDLKSVDKNNPESYHQKTTPTVSWNFKTQPTVPFQAERGNPFKV